MKPDIYIFSTGSEITYGKNTDTNSIWMANELSGLGFIVNRIIVLPDKPEYIEEEIRRVMDKSKVSLILMSGGLGSTQDDYTLSVLCNILKVNYIPLPSAEKKLIAFSRLRGKDYSDILDMTKRQVCIPSGAEPLENEVGLAPGFFVNLNEFCSLAAFPGVPGEMMSMFSNRFLPILKEKYIPEEIYSAHRFVWTIGETVFQRKYIENNPLIEKEGVEWGITARPGYVKLSFHTHEEKSLKDILENLDTRVEMISEEEALPTIHRILTDKKKMLATAESCTGGLISKLITDLPGSSQYFLGSVVSYHNNIKRDVLSVSEDTLINYGAVSEECAREMVEGLEKLYHSDYSISVTGIAGPGGGSRQKPVGLVFIGIKHRGEEAEIHKFNLPLRRELFREYVANIALYLLYKKLEETNT